MILETMSEERGGLGLFRLHEALSFGGVTVPKGFVVELPLFVPACSKAAEPAILHSWLLGLGDERANDVLDEALGVTGVKPTTRRVLVKAVRLWSWWKAVSR